MRVDEITIAHAGGLDLSQVPRDGEIDFGFNHEILGYPMKKNKAGATLSIYYLLDADKVIAGVLCQPITVNNKNYLIVRGTQVDSKYRGKNLAILIYHSIKHNENVNIMSGHRQTAGGKQLWNQLSKAYDIAVMDTATGEVVSRDINDAYINYYGDGDDTLVLVTESTFVENTLVIPSLKIKKKSNPLIEKYYGI